MQHAKKILKGFSKATTKSWSRIEIAVETKPQTILIKTNLSPNVK